MQLERDIINSFVLWKNSNNRKPILLKGARQIGKTWAMREFGRKYFDYVAEFNFDEQEELKALFRATKDVERILKELALYVNVPILPQKTLIIFDEIQECEEALNSLKYFCEHAPQYYIIAAGSLLGIAVKRKKMTVPVGKVNVMQMYPISFQEYLHTADHLTWEYANSLMSTEPLPEIILSRLSLEYKRYLVCGGIPEAVVALLENSGMTAVDKILQDILDMYELDFAKCAEPKNIPRIHSIWHSLPSQLAKENKKFFYNVVKSGARAREYEDSLLWLKDAGIIYQTYNISKPAIPLSGYADSSTFKIYACDCGLLRRLAKLSAEVILAGSEIYTEFRGVIAENAVLQSLIPKSDDMLYYWSSDNKAEIDFLIQLSTEIVPIEVKSETRISSKNLSVYTKKYEPKHRIRLSMNNLKTNDGLLCCPLPLTDWAIWLLDK